MGIVRRTGRGIAGALWGVWPALPLMVMMAGCEVDDYSNHNPPAGQGSLIVDNHTADDISIFLDGVEKGHVHG